MEDIIRIMNPGWIGVIIGVTSLALSLMLYWRSRISGILAVQSRNVSMMGGGDPIFPPEVEVRYRRKPVQRLTSCTVWIWNAGKKTLRKTDLTEQDPLRLHFSGTILNVRIRKVSRSVVQISANVPENETDKVAFGFEFLDPSDGVVLEVLHTGSDEDPECFGTIIGPPKKPHYWGHAWGGYASSYWEFPLWKLSLRRVVLWIMMTIGLCILALGMLGDRVEGVIPIPELESSKSRWFYLTLGLFYTIPPSFLLWIRRRRVPSTLIVDKGVEEN